MDLKSRDPQKRLDEFRRKSSEAMDELLSELPDAELDEPMVFQPEVDLVETSSEFRLYLSVPGMIEDDLLVDIEGRILTIRGERHPPYDMESRGANLQEWKYGFFARQFELSSLIEVDSIHAAYDAGVLTIVAAKLTPKQFSDFDRFNDGSNVNEAQS